MPLSPQQFARISCVGTLMFFGAAFASWDEQNAHVLRGAAVAGIVVAIIGITLGDALRKSWAGAVIACAIGCLLIVLGMVVGWVYFTAFITGACFAWGMEILLRKVRKYHIRRPYEF